MKTILEGSRQLLLDVADILGKRNDVIYVGGWGPYLRNQNNHPGTLDVDLLFPAEHTKEQLSEIAKQFLDAGFSVSAKHSFQLLKEYKIGERSYVYNVDLLHPILEKTHTVDFRDIIEFDITIDGSRIKNLMSICMPYGDVLFTNGMHDLIEVDGREIRLLSPAGVVFSKLQSCSIPKRPRDIYDILLSCQEDFNLWDLLNKLSDADKRVEGMISCYKADLLSKWDFFVECLRQFNVEGTAETQNLLLGKTQPSLVSGE